MDKSGWQNETRDWLDDLRDLGRALWPLYAVAALVAVYLFTAFMDWAGAR